MLMQERDQLAQRNVPDSTAAEVGHEQVKRQLAPVVLLQGLTEDDRVVGGEAEITEKSGVRVNVAGVFAAVEVPQNTRDIVHDFIFGHAHVYLLYFKATEAVQLPSRRCKVIWTPCPKAAAAALVPGTLANAACGNSWINWPPRNRAVARPASSANSSMSAGKRRWPCRSNHKARIASLAAMRPNSQKVSC